MYRFLPLAVLGFLTLMGCGVAPDANDGDQLGEQTDALSFTNTYWQAGTANPRAAKCPGGDVMIGAAFNVNTAMVKCATIASNGMDPGTATSGNATLLGVNPGCAYSGDAIVGFSENLSNGNTSVTCETHHGGTFIANYVDGPGTGTWGQEWFTWHGVSVFGHTCKKLGYSVRAYNIDEDYFVCGT